MHGNGAAPVFGITAICPKYDQPFLAKTEPIRWRNNEILVAEERIVKMTEFVKMEKFTYLARGQTITTFFFERLEILHKLLVERRKKRIDDLWL